MPDTRKRVKIVTGFYPDMPDQPVVLVDGEPLRSVSRIEIDHTNGDGPHGRMPLIKLTLAGIDVDLELEGVPDYYIKVVGPRPTPLDAQ
jgi:hypothetical protein